MESRMATDVLVVGAGPTGLMAANQLQRFGVDHVVLDVKPGPTDESRAIAVTARSLEIYQQMGLTDTILKQSKKMVGFNAYFKGKRRGRVEIGEFGKGLSDFSYLLAFEQSRNETLLAETLEKRGGRVLWNHEFLELLEHTDRVRARVRNAGGEFEIEARYVIACEGARSPIRLQLGFSFEGGTYDHKFFVADTVLSWDLPYDEVVVCPGDENFCAFFALRGERCMRVIGTLPLSFAEKENVEFGDIQEVVVRTAGVPITFEKVNWFSTYRLHHRAVDHFRERRAFLAGDSAHIHSPAGGQGMNTGLQDAYNLAWKLAMVLKHGAGDSLLETYNEERLPFARWLLNFTDRGFRLMTSTNWMLRLFRKHVALRVAGVVMKVDRIKPRLFRTISQLAYSHKGRSLSRATTRQKLRFAAGDRLPYLPGEDLYDRFRAPSFHLLHIASAPLDPDRARELKEAFAFPLELVEEELSDSWKALGVLGELFVLVRPDNYIAYLSDRMEARDLKSYSALLSGQGS